MELYIIGWRVWLLCIFLFSFHFYGKWFSVSWQPRDLFWRNSTETFLAISECETWTASEHILYLKWILKRSVARVCVNDDQSNQFSVQQWMMSDICECTQRRITRVCNWLKRARCSARRSIRILLCEMEIRICSILYRKTCYGVCTKI